MLTVSSIYRGEDKPQGNPLSLPEVVFPVFISACSGSYFVNVHCQLKHGLDGHSHDNLVSSVEVEVLVRCGFECIQLEETMT